MVTMHYFLCFMVITFSHLPIQSLVDAKIEGFSVDLIHADSRLSPFYNQSATAGELSTYDALRSVARIKHFRPSSIDGSKIESVVIPDGGGYLMKISIGSPPVESLAIADTGSDLVWIQCTPCDQCYPQDRPPFDPMKSSSYMELPCDSEPCQALPRIRCGSTGNECEYLYTYGGGSYTVGDLAMESFTFDSSNGQVAAFPNSVFGCGHNNDGTFTRRTSGLVGLGAGTLSLISQLSAEIEQRFTYCLLPRAQNSASKLRFGKDAVISGNGVVSTPILSGDSGPTFYYLSLEGATVGDKMIPNNQKSPGEGNIIIDSGTTLNLLEEQFYNDLEAAVKEAVGLDPVQAPGGSFKLCYDTNSFSQVPEITMVFHFTGADVTLKTVNTFLKLDDITCLSMVPADNLSIYGNVAQINFQVEYNLASKQVSFAPADCTMY